MCHVVNVPELTVQLLSRFCTFLHSCVCSYNAVISTCLSISNSSSLFTRNICLVSSKLNKNRSQLLDLANYSNFKNLIIQNWLDNDVDTVCLSEASVIVDLCRMRGFNSTSFFTSCEIESLLEFTCTLRWMFAHVFEYFCCLWFFQLLNIANVRLAK